MWWQAHAYNLQKLIKVSVACVPVIPALGAICSSRLFLSLGYETLEKDKVRPGGREGKGGVPLHVLGKLYHLPKPQFTYPLWLRHKG